MAAIGQSGNEAYGDQRDCNVSGLVSSVAVTANQSGDCNAVAVLQFGTGRQRLTRVGSGNLL